VAGSDSQCEVGEGDTESVSFWLFGSDLVVASTQVLHERVPGCHGPGGAVPLETAHRSESGFESTMIGFDRVVRVPLDAVQRVRDQLVQDTWVGWGAVGRHLHRDGSGAQRAGQEHPGGGQITPGVEQDVDDLTVLVDGPMQVCPLARDLQVGLVDEPPVPRAVPARPGRLDELGSEPLHPAVDPHVINRDTALGEQLLNVPVGQAIAQVPAHRHRDHLTRGTGNQQTPRTSQTRSPDQSPRAGRPLLNATEPLRLLAGELQLADVRAQRARSC
jgi:hypothetical protein